MSTPLYTVDGKQRPAGEPARGQASAGVFEGPMPRPSLDPKLKRPKRSCTRCGVRFQPTVKRRLLCATCFQWASHNDSPMEPRSAPEEGVP